MSAPSSNLIVRQIQQTLSGAGVIRAGAKRIIIKNTGAASFEYDGETVPAAVTDLDLQVQGKNFSQIAVDATGTTLYIIALY